jgi:hypothetical protein
MDLFSILDEFIGTQPRSCYEYSHPPANVTSKIESSLKT